MGDQDGARTYQGREGVLVRKRIERHSSHLLEAQTSRFTGFIWTEETRKFFHATAEVMREWVKACRRLGV